MKILKHFLPVIVLVFVLIFPYFVFAAPGQTTGALDRLKTVGAGSGYDQGTDETSLSQILGKSISAFLGLLGVVFVILIVYAGYNWMTAAGEEQKVEKAKKTIQRAIIGIIITVSAYAIMNLVISVVID